MPIELADDVARLQLRLCSRRSRHYLIHHHPVAVRISLLPGLGRATHDSQITANYPTVFQHAFEHRAHGVGWNRKANSLRTATAGNDLFVNTHNFPAQVDQGPAAVAWIDCRVRLEQITAKIRAVRLPLPANDSVRHRLLQSKRIADGQNKVSWLHRVGVSEFERFDTGIIDFEHRQIQLGIGADQPGLLGATIAQLHLNLVHLIDHVSVGDDVTFIGHNHAGAQRVLHERLIARTAIAALVTEEKFEGIKPILAADADFLRRFHRNYRREHAAHQRAPLPVQCLQRGDLL